MKNYIEISGKKKIVQNDLSRKVIVNNIHSYSYKIELTIDHTKIDDDLINFPILVKLTSSNFDFTKSLNTGYDIRFTDTSSNLLYFERERHDSINQLGEYWVKIPNISSSVDTKFIMYFGNKSSHDGSNSHGVWDNSFRMVQHFSESTVAIAPDSTLYLNSGNNVSSTINQPGKIARCRHFAYGNRIDVPNKTSLNSLYGITLEAWINGDWFYNDYNSWNRIMTKGTGYQPGMWRWFTGNGQLYLEGVSDIGDYWYGQFVHPIITGVWYYVALTFDGNICTQYINEDIGITAYSARLPVAGKIATLQIGGTTTALYDQYIGYMDEVRISDGARSIAWIKATYRSEINSLLTFGPEIII